MFKQSVNVRGRPCYFSTQMAGAAVPDEQKCQMSFLGNSGLKVSNICLGGMTFGEHVAGTPGQLDEQGSHEMLDRFLEWGGNFIDTANVYGRGKSETIIGNWITRQNRDRVVIATKARQPMDQTDPNDVGLSRRHITQSLEQSLQRLKTDYVDLFQIHIWDDGTPLVETLMTLNDLVRCGKVRYLGASNLSGWQMQKIVEVSKQMGFNPFIALQQQYNLIERVSELEPFQVCKIHGIGVMPWSPLRAGFLTGKVKKGQTPAEGRMAYSAVDPTNRFPASHPQWGRLDKEHNWAILDVVQDIAQARGKSMAQVSLRWLLQKPVVSSVIVGANKITQLEDNMGAANGWTLTDQEMSRLDEVSKPDLPYPYDMLWKLNAGRKNPWNCNGYV